MNYPVHELFSTFQGEGDHMGTPAYFVRLFGCPVHCPWCDSAGTWHPDFIPKDIAKMSAGEIVEQSGLAYRAVITGGEPAIHDLTELCECFAAEDIEVALETSGAFRIKGIIDWITLSPKRWKLPLAENVQIAQEFKFIIEKVEDIDFYTGILDARHFDYNKDRSIWLHPEWSQRGNPEVLNAIIEAVKGHHRPYRAGWQLHKLYGVDFQDIRSRQPVPLGGDPSRGF